MAEALYDTYYHAREVTLKRDDAEIKKVGKKETIANDLLVRVTGIEEDGEQKGSVFATIAELMQKAFDGVMKQWEDVEVSWHEYE